MTVYQLCYLIQKRNNKQFKRLELFIDSTISEVNINEQKLFNYIKTLNDMRVFSTNKACIYLNLDKRKVYDIQKNLFQAIEFFLIQEEVKKDKQLKASILLKIYGKDKYDFDLFKKTYEEINLKTNPNDEKEKKALGNYDHHLLIRKYQAHLLHYDYSETLNTTNRSSFLEKAIQQKIESDDTEILRLACLKLSLPSDNLEIHKQVDLIVNKIESDEDYSQKHPIPYIYYLAYQLTTQHNKVITPKVLSAYYFLKSFLVDTSHELDRNHFTRSLKGELFQFLSNFCIVQIKNGDEHYLDEFVNIYQHGSSEEYLKENATVNNIITTLIILSKNENHELLSKFKTKIESKQILLPQNIERLFNGIYYHYMKNYDAACKELTQVFPKNELHRTYVDIPLIKMYIEDGNFELAETRRRNLKLFLKKKKKESNTKNIRYLKKVISHLNHSIKKDKKQLLVDKEKLLKQINEEENSDNFSLKNWMLEILENCNS